MAENVEKTLENIVNELKRLYDIEKDYESLVKALEKTSEKDIGVQQDERVFERIAAMKKSPGQSDQIQAVSAQCKFDTEYSWGPCTIEHHNLVQSEPEKWPGYRTRLLYTAQQGIRVYGWVWKDKQTEDDCYIPSYTPAQHVPRGELFALVDPADLHEPLQNTKWF